jgi:predicted AAA+ superfamily ATPase
VGQLCFSDHKIAMISGPRQCGKTTFGKMLLHERGAGAYRNWDDVEFRRIWAKTPSAIVPPARPGVTPLLVLDEIHKDARWKRRLKGIYDMQDGACDILVTGSARLNVYAKGSDSLLGRYFHFRLHPFSLREMHSASSIPPTDVIDALFSRSLRPASANRDNFEALMRFGPFPNPLFAQDERKARLWRRSRSEVIVREDLRDISRIPELGRIEMMVAMLPERVGAMFSTTSLREDLEVSFNTVKRWLAYLNDLYYLYQIKPFTGKIQRSLKREGKIYFWDWSEVPEEAARFENLVAGHLLKACHFWTDTGEGKFELFLLRTKEKQEVDFLIVRDGQPWLPVEVKLRDTEPSPNWAHFLGMLPCKRGLQIVSGPAWNLRKVGPGEVLVAGAAEALEYLV